MNTMEVKIKELSQEFKLNAKVLNETIYITSKYDEWYIEDMEGYYQLHHKNKKHDKDKYHAHNKRFGSLNEIFVYIVKHDEYTIDKRISKPRYTNRLDMLFAKIAQT